MYLVKCLAHSEHYVSVGGRCCFGSVSHQPEFLEGREAVPPWTVQPQSLPQDLAHAQMLAS